jgi:hypothetical protein
LSLKILKKTLFRAALVLFAALSAGAFSACDYGRLGGADKTETYLPGDTLFERALASYAGIWYSHYAGTGRLDGYRIGTFSDFAEWGIERARFLFPAADFETIHTYTGATPAQTDYLILYDDAVFGQNDAGEGGGSPGDGSLRTAYLGVVRALNVFNGDRKRGALIIEYVEKCAPLWLERWPEAAGGGRPFFGIYYRELDGNTVQMANAVNLAALYAGKRYYTETERLSDAIAANNVENEAEFISWGVVIPQDRER